MKCEQGLECDQLVGGCQWYETEFYQGQFLECNLICSEDATVIYNKIVVAVGSCHSNPGWITQNGQMRAVKQAPIWQYVIVSQEAKLINFDIMNPRSKSSGGRRANSQVKKNVKKDAISTNKLRL